MTFPLHGAPVAIIIAARNEASTLPATLAGLASQDYDAAIRVVVCVNGTTDDTAAQVISMQQSMASRLDIRLVELVAGGKPGALNAGDRVVTERWPDAATRIYLDADVLLSTNAVSQLVGELDKHALIAAPRTALQPTRSWLVNLGARAWLRLPWVQGDIVGSGIYAVSTAARARWGEYPDVIADDGFAAWQFAPAERGIAELAVAELRFPDRWREMLRVQRRWIEGGEELAASTHRPAFGPAWSSSQRLRAMAAPSVFFAALLVRLMRIAARLLTAPVNKSEWTTPR